MVSQRIGPACTAGAIVVLSVLAVAQAPRPSIIVQAATPPPQRNILVLYYDAAFLFVGRHYGDGRDFVGPTEPGIFVHSKASDRWLQITAISTEGGRFGKSSSDMVVSVGWDFTAFAQRPYIEQPLKTTGSLMFPDRIEYDNRTERYELRHASRSSGRFPGAETVLYIRRADLIEAFARARGIAPTGPGLSRSNQRLQPTASAVSSQ
jgi:hypothetical protein